MNNRTTKQRPLQALLAVLFTVAVFVRAEQMRLVEAKRQEPVGHYTPKQIMALTAPLVRALGPASGDVQLTAEPHRAYSHNGQPIHVWDVGCYDRSGQEIGYFWWNAESGALVRCDMTPSTETPTAPHLDQAAAALYARHWATIVGWGTGWQVRQQPKLAAGTWLVLLNNKTESIRAQVDAHTGRLIYIMLESEAEPSGSTGLVSP